MRALPGLLLVVLAGGCRPASPGAARGYDAASAGDEQSPEPARKGPEMDALREKVLDGKLSATAIAKGLGPSANPELLPLATNPTPRVRQIALACLAETGGPDAARALARGDARPRQHGAHRGAFRACAGSTPDPAALPDMMSALDKGTDGIAKQQVALAVGQTPGGQRGRPQGALRERGRPRRERGLHRGPRQARRSRRPRRVHRAPARLERPRARSLASTTRQVRPRGLAPEAPPGRRRWAICTPLDRIGAHGMPGPQSLARATLSRRTSWPDISRPPVLVPGLAGRELHRSAARRGDHLPQGASLTSAAPMISRRRRG